MTHYGVWNNREQVLWRGPYHTKAEAQVWIDEWLEDGGVDWLFSIRAQEVSDWYPITLDRAT